MKTKKLSERMDNQWWGGLDQSEINVYIKEVKDLEQKLTTMNGHLNSYVDEVKKLRKNHVVAYKQMARVTQSREEAEDRLEKALELLKEAEDWTGRFDVDKGFIEEMKKALGSELS